MKAFHFKIILLLAFFTISLSSLAQNKYELKTSKDEVEIFAKWKYPAKKGVEQAAELLLKVVNNMADPIHLEFEVVFSYKARTVETFSVDTCMKAGKTITGKLNGIYFVSSALSNEQIRSEDFLWEINDLASEIIEKCPVDK